MRYVIAALMLVITGCADMTPKADMDAEIRISTAFSDAEANDIMLAIQSWNDMVPELSLKPMVSDAIPNGAVRVEPCKLAPGVGGVTHQATFEDISICIDVAKLHGETNSTVRSVAGHEMGHALGLQHGADPSQIMFSEARAEKPTCADARQLADVRRTSLLPECL